MADVGLQQLTDYGLAIQPGRGFEQAAVVLGNDFAGFLVRDGSSLYRQFAQAMHQSCLAPPAAALPGDDAGGRKRGASVSPGRASHFAAALQLRQRRAQAQIGARGVAVGPRTTGSAARSAPLKISRATAFGVRVIFCRSLLQLLATDLHLLNFVCYVEVVGSQLHRLF